MASILQIFATRGYKKSTRDNDMHDQIDIPWSFVMIHMLGVFICIFNIVTSKTSTPTIEDKWSQFKHVDPTKVCGPSRNM